MYLDDAAARLVLHHPCDFRVDTQSFHDTRVGGWRANPGRLMNRVHSSFSRDAGWAPERSRKDIATALALGATEVVSNGMHARNAALVAACDRLIAFGYDAGPAPVRGGTAHAWREAGRRRIQRVYVQVTSSPAPWTFYGVNG